MAYSRVSKSAERLTASCVCKSLAALVIGPRSKSFTSGQLLHKNVLEGLRTILSHPHSLPENHCNILAVEPPEGEMPPHSPSRLLQYKTMSEGREDPAQKHRPQGGQDKENHSTGETEVISNLPISGLMAMRFASATSRRVVLPIGNTKLRPV